MYGYYQHYFILSIHVHHAPSPHQVAAAVTPGIPVLFQIPIRLCRGVLGGTHILFDISYYILSARLKLAVLLRLRYYMHRLVRVL